MPLTDLNFKFFKWYRANGNANGSDFGYEKMWFYGSVANGRYQYGVLNSSATIYFTACYTIDTQRINKASADFVSCVPWQGFKGHGSFYLSF
jgi:hypothetical protein